MRGLEDALHCPGENLTLWEIPFTELPKVKKLACQKLYLSVRESIISPSRTTNESLSSCFTFTEAVATEYFNDREQFQQ